MQALKNYFLCNHRMTRKPYFFITIFAGLIYGMAIFYVAPPVSMQSMQQVQILSQQESAGKITEAEYNAKVQMLGKKTSTKALHSTALSIIGGIIFLLLLPSNIMRLKDLEYPLWLVFISFLAVLFAHIQVPLLIIETLNIASIVLGFFLFFKRGTKGPNRYGQDLLELQPTG